MTLEPVGIDVREYQQSIAKSALSANTLIVIPTGLGKTIIALLIAIERLNKHGGKIVMLAPTRPLTVQHCAFFREHVKESDGMPSSAVLTGTVSPETRTAMFNSVQMVFATPQTIQNDVAGGRYTLRDVSLLIVDEAHRCVKKYSYTAVATHYRQSATNPLIIGLTASPSAEKARVQEICKKLGITNVESRTDTDADVAEYVMPVSVNWERVQLLPEQSEISALLHKVLDEKIGKLRNMRHLPRNVAPNRRMLLDLATRLRSQLAHHRSGFLFAAIMLQAQAMTLFHAIDLIETQTISSAHTFLEKIGKSTTRSGKSLAKDLRIIEALKLIGDLSGVEHPKVEKLKELVAAQFSEKPDSKIIVFTQFRNTVTVLIKALQIIPGVLCARLVGQADKEAGEEGLKQSEQVKVLQDFSAGKYNVLATTSIGEEGLHVSDVDHVIFYEPVPSAVRSIQRRGRTGRTRIGKVTILIAEGTVDEAYYWKSRNQETKMRRLIETMQKQGIKKSVKKRGQSTLEEF
jgi:Fanconi anemia group M protein